MMVKKCGMKSGFGTKLPDVNVTDIKSDVIPVRIHKSYLVNLKCITEMFPWTGNGLAMKLKGYENTILPVGRERLKTLKQILNI